MDLCAFCGSELPVEARFCGYCGRVNIAAAEMPTHISGFPAGMLTFENAPTAFVRPAPPAFDSGVQEAASGRNARAQGPDTPYVTFPSEEGEDDEEERRRLALLLGIPLAAGLVEVQPSAGVPLVQGTPQPAGVPQIQESPARPGATPPVYPAAAPATPGIAGNTPPPQAVLHSSWPGPPTPVPPSPSPAPGHGSPSPRPRAGSCALTSLILAVIVLIIFGTLGGFLFGLPPVITLAGSNVVEVGGGLHLHGSHFFPFSSITLSLDNGQQIFTPSTASGTARSAGSAALPMNAADLLNAAPMALKANGFGSFDITIPVSASWHVGAHTLHATEALASRSAGLQFSVVLPGAKLVATPTSLNFGSLAVGAKTVLAVAVNNGGGKALSWQAHAAATPWLKLSPADGIILPAAPAQFIYVTADATQLTAGSYAATFTITANTGATVQVAVNLQVIAQVQKQQARLDVAPTTLDFGSLDVGKQLTRSITIGNTGTLPLQWKADSGNAGWVILDTASQTVQVGDRPATVNVTVQTHNLAAGSQSATLTISSNGGNQQVVISVNVNQSSTGQLCTLQSPTPAGLSFSANAGSNPVDQTFTVAVAGNCARGVTITPSAVTAAGSNWLFVSPPTATLSSGSMAFTVHVASSSLGPGSYSASISLDAASGGSAVKSSPQIVRVALSVSAVPPGLALNTTSLSFNLSNGDGATSKAFTISNTGGSALDWTTKLESPGFVGLSRASGSGLAAAASVSDSVNVDPANLQAGAYTATVHIYATDPLSGKAVKGSPATIAVSITITAPPALLLSTTSLSFTPGSCVYTATSTVALTNTGGGTLAWNVGDPVYIDARDPGGWLSVAPAGQGSGNATLTLSVNGYGSKVISGQTYTAKVTVTPSAGGPQTITVTFTEPSCLR